MHKGGWSSGYSGYRAERGAVDLDAGCASIAPAPFRSLRRHLPRARSLAVFSTLSKCACLFSPTFSQKAWHVTCPSSCSPLPFPTRNACNRFWRCKSFDMGDYLMSGADYRSDVIVQASGSPPLPPSLSQSLRFMLI